VALLLDRCWLGVALRHDDAAQVSTVLARHVLPSFFTNVITEVNLAVFFTWVQENAPTVVAHLDMAKLSPALWIYAHGGTQVNIHIGRAFWTHVVPPIDEVGLPLFKRTLQGAVFAQVHVVRNFFAVVDTGHESLQKLKATVGSNLGCSRHHREACYTTSKHQTRFKSNTDFSPLP
jgi:hypothetical protein